MHKIINKYIIGVLGFYIFWIGIMPHAITGIVNVVCKNINHNTRYTINVENFKTRLSVLPTISFKADKIVFGFDDKSFETKLDDFNLQCRILPLLSGRFHINYIVIGNVELNKTLEKNLSLDKDFFNKLEKAKYCIDKVEVSKFNSNFYKKEINKPII